MGFESDKFTEAYVMPWWQIVEFINIFSISTDFLKLHLS